MEVNIFSVKNANICTKPEDGLRNVKIGAKSIIAAILNLQSIQ